MEHIDDEQTDPSKDRVNTQQLRLDLQRLAKERAVNEEDLQRH
jgi:hypothetical protein